MDTREAYAEEDRRTGTDRRSWHCQYEFPYIDSHGFLVIDDRRQSSDRRDIGHLTSDS